MLVTRSKSRTLSFVLSVSVVVLFCCGVLIGQKGNYKERNGGERGKIVAYSLLKQIEIESEEIKCGKISVGGEERRNEGLWTNLEGSNLYIYSVYYDRRLYPYQYLRIIAMVKGSWSDPLFCQTLSPNGHYHITKAIPTKIWSKSWNRNDSHIYHNPFLISCPTSVNTTSVYLSLNKNPCQIGCQKFKISLKPQPIKNTFTLCVKPLNFRKDISDHLLQWVAINRVLGADKIDLYVESVPKKTQKFLEFVQQRLNGSLEVRPHRRISEGVDHDVSTQVWQKRRYEIITYNDCLYRNLHTSHFVIPVDVDEIIVPRHVSTWAELLQDVSPEGEDSFASYTVRNAYYLRHFNVKRSQDKVFFLRDLTRSEFSAEGESGKSFVSTSNALTVFNHYALKGLKPGVRRNKFLKRESVQMNHYKDDCDTVILPECAKYLSSPVRIVDDVIVKYKKLFYKEYAKLVALLERQRL